MISKKTRVKYNSLSHIFLFFLIIFLITPNSIGVYETNSNLEKTLKTNYESFNTLYTYHTYNSLLSDMENLELLYPNIFELYTAQDEYSLPDVTSGSETYKTWIMRITNENTGFNKPEVLFIGGHHGDETVGIEVAYYYAEWLVENYDNDPFIKYLVDNREIYIMPVVNPYGWEHNQRYDEHGLDMNRDYPYDENSGSGTRPSSTGVRQDTVNPLPSISTKHNLHTPTGSRSG